MAPGFAMSVELLWFRNILIRRGEMRGRLGLEVLVVVTAVLPSSAATAHLYKKRKRWSCMRTRPELFGYQKTPGMEYP